MDNLIIAFNAVFPYVFYMTFGYLIVNLFHLTDIEFLRKMNGLVFKCFFPLVMFKNFMSMSFESGFNMIFFLFTPVMLLAIIFLTFYLVKGLKNMPDNQKGVFIMCVFRSNAILFALPLSANVFGAEGSAASALITAISVPIFNIASIVVLEYFHDRKSSFGALIKKIFTNPLIMGALAGTVVLIFKIPMPSFLMKPITAISDMTTPLAVVILGGMLTFTGIKKNLKLLSLGVFMRLIVVPAVIVILTLFLSFTPAQRFATFCVFGTPCAVSGFTMACNMGGDPDLAGGYVAFTTVISVLTIFVWILLMKTVGII